MRKAVFIMISSVAVTLACAAMGLTLSPYIARQLGYAPFQGAMVDESGAAKTLVELIGSAQKNLVVAAELIDSRAILEAIEAKGKSGVPVAVLLSGPGNSQIDRGARGWLTDHGVPVRVTTKPFSGSFVVVDQAVAAVSTAPMMSSSAYSQQNVRVLVFRHKPTAEKYFAAVKELSLR